MNQGSYVILTGSARLGYTKYLSGIIHMMDNTKISYKRNILVCDKYL